MNNIRVLISMLGLDQHEFGAIAVSKLLRDHGMEVIYIGRFNKPEVIVKTGIEEDVDVIGLSCHSWEYLHYMPELMDLLKQQGADIPIVAGGSIITPKDRIKLLEMGVAGAFGPSSTHEEIVAGIKAVAAKDLTTAGS